MRRFSLFLYLFSVDSLIFLFSLFLAYKIRIFLGNLFHDVFPIFDFSFYHFLKILGLPFLFFCIVASHGLYTQNFYFIEETKRILRAIFLWIVLVFFLTSLLKKSDEISRTVLILQALFLSFFLPIGRKALKIFLIKKRLVFKRVFVVGITEKTLEIIEALLKTLSSGYVIKGLFDEESKERIDIGEKKFRVRSLEVLKRAIRMGLADTVIFSLDLYRGREKLLLLVSEVQKAVPEVFLVPSDKVLPLLNSERITLYPPNITLLRSQSRMNSKVSRFIKAFFDLTLSLLLLPAVFLLGALIALLIKIETPGPIFFVQERVGKNGKKFRLYKFRTMYVDAEKRLNEILEKRADYMEEWIKRRKLPDDPRITRIGKFLRRFSLDELPQFLNILKGEMSLIGPRPVTEEEIEKYYMEYKKIYYQVKPGLTGLWQVSGRNEIDYPTRVLLDVYYVLNWSIWLDLYILLKTIPAIITGKGAY